MKKHLVQMSIPAEIVKIATAIVYLADHDETLATVVSDDLIQFDNAYAGLVDAEERSR
jgi:hypothetical protein